MKTLKYILFACFLTLSMWAGAQGITRVSGTVQDAIDVLPGVNIVEIDGSNRMVNATVTDMNGNFVLQIKSSKNKLKFSYIGYKTVILPINKTLFNITMEDNAKVMTDVVITAKKKMQTSGLTIPEREVSFAAEGISAKEFEGLVSPRWTRRCKDVSQVWTLWPTPVTWVRVQLCVCVVPAPCQP